MYTVRLSVRSLVEYVFSRGSLTVGYRSNQRLVDGTRVHQSVQNDYQNGDKKEFYLKSDISFDNVNFIIDGRCDGVLLSRTPVTIDEIKSTSESIEELNENDHLVHWAQVTLYAYIYAKQFKMETMGMQLTYVQKDTGNKKIFLRTKSFNELEGDMMAIIKKYLPFAQWKRDHDMKKSQTIRELSFPYSSYRKGQRQLTGAVYKTIMDKTNLFANAPTGIGKTMSTIFPSIKAMADEEIKRIIYLTSKTTTAKAVKEAFERLYKEGLNLKTVTITAKEKMCFKDEMNCHKDYCEFANGYYDRVNDAVIDVLRNGDMIDRTFINHYATKHQVCPFEFSLDLAYHADAIICDYNYIFDPKVSLKRYTEEMKGKTVLLIDEAHNLVERARTMFSAGVYKSDFLDISRLYKQESSDIYKASKEINAYFIAMKKQYRHKKIFVMNELQEELITLFDTFVTRAEVELTRENGTVRSQRLLDTYFLAQDFLRTAKLYDDKFVTYIDILKNDVHCKMFCFDPSVLIQQMGKGYHSRIYFSATLSPFKYFRHMLGATSTDYSIRLSSPFNQEQLTLQIKRLSTRYRDRDRTKEDIIQLVKGLINEKSGHYMVFFPSYKYMNDVATAFEDEDLRLLVQGYGMSEEDREAFLQHFKGNVKETVLGFAVLGGIFSEGIDLIGQALIGVIIIGVGLPQINLESDLIKELFNNMGINGYDFAYVYPGMVKVLQAAGRLIRSEDDAGKLILVDDRYLTGKYQSLLPPEWENYHVLS